VRRQDSACGDVYTSLSAAHSNDQETFNAEKRAVKVSKQHLTTARDLHQKFHKPYRGEVGTIEEKLFEFGAGDRAKPYADVGFALGAFGQLI
jgi:hypothetical protein